MKKIENFETLCVHASRDVVNDPTGSVSVPIYQSATFAHPSVGQSTGYDYSRLQNPTREALEVAVCKLESGDDAIAFSTGMAALTTALELFAPGDHLIVSEDLYGGSHRLFSHIGEKNHLHFSFIDTSSLDNIKSCVTEDTKAIFLETPTNPMMQVSDIQEVSIYAKDKNFLLIVDNTFLTPYFQKPLSLGADLVLHSGTKYLAGHNDTLAGFLVSGNPELSERLRFIAKTIGACLAPIDSWLVLRGIKTLALRLERQQANAMAIADMLNQHPNIVKVHYVGLKDHPGYKTMLKQTTGFGAMISFQCKSKEIAHGLLEKIQIIQFAESLGGVESLMTYPMTQTHADVPEDERLHLGITDCLLRLSVGIESEADLIEDLRQALEVN